MVPLLPGRRAVLGTRRAVVVITLTSVYTELTLYMLGLVWRFDLDSRVRDLTLIPESRRISKGLEASISARFDLDLPGEIRPKVAEMTEIHTEIWAFFFNLWRSAEVHLDLGRSLLRFRVTRRPRRLGPYTIFGMILQCHLGAPKPFTHCQTSS